MTCCVFIEISIKLIIEVGSFKIIELIVLVVKFVKGCESLSTIFSKEVDWCVKYSNPE